MGGYHATFRDKEILSLGMVDYIVKGEGEYTFPAFVQNLEDKKIFITSQVYPTEG